MYGRKFMIITDHKPLISLIHELKAVPQMASQRIMRWAVLLRAYEYVIKYREGKNNSNADGLSRLPLPENLPKEVAAEDQVLMVDQDHEGVMTSEQLQRWTTKDPILSRVREYALRGWPTTQHPNFQPYKQRQQELSVQDGCVLWGARVVIPERGRRPLLEQLHQSHPGMSRMKGLARSYMWWPHMENDIEDKVRSCSTCQEHRHRPEEAPLHPWEWPEKPWRRIHIDYAGPFLGKMFLVIVDAHSKWLNVYPVPSATAAATIDCLRNCFSTHGLPEMLVSDNAQCFVSAQTKEFMAKNGITHVTSAPYHPASNGLAERAVQTFKELMKKSTGDTLTTKLNRALFSYRITPQSTTGKSPAELMMGQKLRCTLDLIHPDLKQKVTAKQDSQRLGPKWIPGLIQEMTGPVSYLVMLGNGTVVRRHVNQLFARLELCLAAGMPEGHPGEPPKAAPNISAETGDEDERHMEGAGLEVDNAKVQRTVLEADRGASGGDGAGHEAGHDSNDVQPTTWKVAGQDEDEQAGQEQATAWEPQMVVLQATAWEPQMVALQATKTGQASQTLQRRQKAEQAPRALQRRQKAKRAPRARRRLERFSRTPSRNNRQRPDGPLGFSSRNRWLDRLLGPSSGDRRLNLAGPQPPSPEALKQVQGNAGPDLPWEQEHNGAKEQAQETQTPLKCFLASYHHHV
ncbi:uncharacterized protein LOC102215153 [Pundamilia nyererei]|uniref:Gypsy retrotransposon integrase-like protein 1 n=1 Tax=Pundamilia nyererei TaxID=303518 RepID=A0A9Y6J5R6_9CICH|nr:PREDICTED: uncharacterized protein LOC102215153 [Pundamilia nyererei]